MSGEDSGAAFEAAFGSSASELWDDVLKRYARRPPTTRRQFDPAELDLDFVVTAAGDRILQPLTRYLSDKADARRVGRAGLPSLAGIAGRWDQLKFAGQCGDPLTFTYQPDQRIVTIENFYSAPGSKAIPALFAYERLDEDAFRLTNITAETYPNVIVTSDYRVSMRSDSVFCLDEYPVNRTCTGVFHRCDRSD